MVRMELNIILFKKNIKILLYGNIINKKNE